MICERWASSASADMYNNMATSFRSIARQAWGLQQWNIYNKFSRVNIEKYVDYSQTNDGKYLAWTSFYFETAPLYLDQEDTVKFNRRTNPTKDAIKAPANGTILVMASWLVTYHLLPSKQGGSCWFPDGRH